MSCRKPLLQLRGQAPSQLHVPARLDTLLRSGRPEPASRCGTLCLFLERSHTWEGLKWAVLRGNLAKIDCKSGFFC